MLKIYIVILNWNRGQVTVRCLDSIAKLKKKSFQVETIVVDNSSDDNSLKLIKNSYPEIKIIQNEKNLGYAGGNNVGIKYALSQKTDYVFILNNDCLLSENVITELIITGKQHNADIICPKIYFTKGFEFHKNRYKQTELGRVIWFAGGVIDWKNVTGFHYGVDLVDNGQFDKEKEVDFATGAAMLVNQAVFAKIGFFDERYFLYYEDLAYCQKLIKNSGKINFSPKAILWHDNAGSSKSGSTLQEYYITRNRLLFGFGYAPVKSKISLIKESIRMLFRGTKWQKTGVCDFYLGKFGKGSYE